MDSFTPDDLVRWTVVLAVVIGAFWFVGYLGVAWLFPCRVGRHQLVVMAEQDRSRGLSLHTPREALVRCDLCRKYFCRTTHAGYDGVWTS
jgi:hypothetical protein